MAILRVDVEPEHLLAFLEELQAGGLERLEKPWRVQMSFRWVWGGVGNLVYGWLWCVGGGGGGAAKRRAHARPSRRRLHFQPGIDALQPYTQHQRLDAD